MRPVSLMRQRSSGPHVLEPGHGAGYHRPASRAGTSMSLIRWYLNKWPMRGGKSHLFSLFQKQITRDGPVVCSYDGDLRIRADLNDWLQRQIFMYGIYRVEEKHRHMMLSRVREGGTIVDVGAHIGYYSLLFAKRAGQSGRVFAFEPSTQTHARLVENISLNDLANITTVKAAASDEAGTATINLAAGSNTGSTSLHFDNGAVDTEQVETIVIDDYLERHGIDEVNLIKIDVEGHELHALQGLRRTVSVPAEKAPELFVEVNENTLQSAGTPMKAIFDELATAGYKAYRIISANEVRLESQPFADSLVYFSKR
ncbi:MAG: FkbM family methyltransferase [Hyphomicrobium sp.]